MLLNGKFNPHITQLQATEELEMFLKGSEYLIAHGEVDFQTIQALLKKTKESPSFETVQKIDSQKFYKSVMWCDYNVTKYGMKTIMEYFRDSLFGQHQPQVVRQIQGLAVVGAVSGGGGGSDHQPPG